MFVVRFEFGVEVEVVQFSKLLSVGLAVAYISVVQDRIGIAEIDSHYQVWMAAGQVCLLALVTG